MRKVIFLSLFFSSTRINAQVIWSAKLGSNLTTLGQNNGPRVSIHLGGSATVSLSRNLFLQPELFYSGQGAYFSNVQNYNDFPELAVATIRANYLNQPILLKYKLHFGLYAETGPQWGVLLRATEDDGTKVNNEFTPLDFSWVFGLGFVNVHQVGFDIRYSMGINDSYRDGNPFGKNTVIQLDFFFRILKKLHSK